MAAVHDPIQAAFTEAVRDFKSKLKNDQLYAEIVKTKSIDEVYQATDALQADQAKQGRLRHLSKIQPYLEGLRGYADVVDTFVQVKPDILALIWGPIKLLIQLATSLTQSMDALINTAAEIGELLPEFKLMTTMFHHNDQLKLVLALFFQDILDFYAVALKFFTLPHWRYMFEALWPKQKDKINIVMNHIGRHTTLMRNQVRLEHIREEHEHRQRAFEHFETTQRSNRRQEYNIIKTDLSPKSYDTELYRIRGGFCEGTGNWLKQDNDFKKWLDVDDRSIRILWLQGIPGAGKTFLAGIAIDFATSSTRTIFAFLSHASSSNTSALSVVHSLIFQLTSEDESLQAVLCNSTREKLNNNLDVAIELLRILLSSAGHVSIIIDGVDEIDSTERGRLLNKLCDTSKACEKAILLISSRAEDDIARILSPVSSIIRVDTHNAGSIQAFTDDWARRWFSTRDFLPEDKSEIENLLAPLSSKAKGMFLYAKIMLSSVEQLDNLDEIRDELRVLPEDLNEAYGRVFEKINNLKSNIVKTKCRLILGWISCSPTPLTLLELEQALVVTLSSTSRVSSPLNPVRLCGPIVEVIKGHVRFVHFTVKEYIHSTRIGNYIDPTEATLSLATCCIQYLCQDHHSPGIRDDELEDGIKLGNYRLHYYATDMWLNLVVQYLRLTVSKDLSNELIAALDKLHKERGKYEFSGGTELEGQRYPSELQQIESYYPDLFCFLRNVAQFQQKCTTSLYHLEEVNKWTAIDSLTTSSISEMLYAKFDQLSCQTVHTDQPCCSYLARHYGQQLFKCGFMSCPSYRQGFPTRSDRDSHKRSHDRSWKCDVPSCHYSEVGFPSKAMRDKHLDFHREEAQDHRPCAETLLLNPNPDDIQPLLFDLICADDVGSFEKLLPGFLKLSPSVRDELIKFAARSGSTAMMELIYEKESGYYVGSRNVDYMIVCMDGQNIEVFMWLRSKTTFSHWWDVSKLLTHAIANGLIEMAKEVETLLKELNKKPRKQERGAVAVLLNRRIIKATARCPDREEYLINLWVTFGVINLSLSNYLLINALRYVADTTFSMHLTWALLQYGVHVDSRTTYSHPTALHLAARHSSAEAAELVKFLLYQGADPELELSSRGKTHQIKKEKGAKEIGKWLNMTWDELVQKVREDRKNGVQWSS
ncbi:hypothetical protein PT974_11978 [Cladobotryum mycophilum]|uniref:NACHT domain-containing protein n=1 Tax=Cladobotryum mycophilum TaxID=491253 RepID=A0ABR0S7B2_9HYPO